MMGRGEDLFYLVSHPQSSRFLLGPQAKWQTQIFRFFWKARSVGEDLTSNRRIFHRMMQRVQFQLQMCPRLMFRFPRFQVNNDEDKVLGQLQITTGCQPFPTCGLLGLVGTVTSTGLCSVMALQCKFFFYKKAYDIGRMPQFSFNSLSPFVPPCKCC